MGQLRPASADAGRGSLTAHSGRAPRRRTPRRASALSSSAKVSLAWVVRDAVDMYLAEKWPLLFKHLG